MAKRKKKTDDVKPEFEPEDPSIGDVVDAGFIADEPEPEPETTVAEKPVADKLKFEPVAPSREHIIEMGYTPEAADRIMGYFATFKERCDSEFDHPKNTKIVMRPGVRLATKQSKSYWCIGQKFSPGKSREFLLSSLSDDQLREIKHKDGKTMIADFTDIAVEVEIGSSDEV